jgi:hypothetical protein
MALDSNGLRVVGYVAVAVAAAIAGRRERERRKSEPGLWPSFWFFTAALFLVMGLGRASHLAGLIADLGRREAVTAGWYGQRWEFQSLAVAVIALLWLVLVITALWRMPARRSRYLPAALVTASVVCFVGVRLLSLHDIDALLYRLQFAGVELGELTEMALLVLALVITLRHARTPRRRQGLSTPAGAGSHGRAAPPPSDPAP